MTLLYAPWLLLALLLPLRLLRLKADLTAPWESKIDLPILLGGALFITLLCAFSLHDYALSSSTTSCDVVDVCASTVLSHHIGEPLRDAEGARQPGAALFPSILARYLGVINGLAVGALISAFGTALALGLWARALFGRPGAIGALMFIGAVGALVVQPRHLSFYPEAALGVAWTAAAGAIALRWRGPLSLGIAGAGIGLGLLVDPLALLYGAVPFAIALGVALWRPPRAWPSSLGALLLPIALSFMVASVVTPPGALSFEERLLTYLQDSSGITPLEPSYMADDLRGDGKPVDFKLRALEWALDQSIWQAHSAPGERGGWRWGHSGPIQAVRTGVFAVLHRRLIEGEVGVETPWDYELQRALQVRPWLPVAPALFLLTAIALRRRPLEWLALGLTLIPFAVSFYGALDAQVWPKTLMAPSIPLPVLLAGSLVTLIFSQGGGGTILNSLKNTVIAGALALALTLGLIPNWLSISAPWRGPFQGDEGLLQLYYWAEKVEAGGESRRPSQEGHRICEWAMISDMRGGVGDEVWIYKSKNTGWDY